MSITAPTVDDLIDLSHIIDDIEKQRTKMLREVQAAVSLLDTALHALRDGALEITDEFIDRSLDHLRAGLAVQK